MDERKQYFSNEESALPAFSTTALILHGPEQFIFSFRSDIPPTPTLIKNLVLSPQHAKRFLSALSNNIARYEEKFGPIRDILEPIPQLPEATNADKGLLRQFEGRINQMIQSVEAFDPEGILSGEEKKSLHEATQKLRSAFDARDYADVSKVSEDVAKLYNDLAETLYERKRKKNN